MTYVTTSHQTEKTEAKSQEREITYVIECPWKDNFTNNKVEQLQQYTYLCNDSSSIGTLTQLNSLTNTQAPPEFETFSTWTQTLPKHENPSQDDYLLTKSEDLFTPLTQAPPKFECLLNTKNRFDQHTSWLGTKIIATQMCLSIKFNTMKHTFSK